MTGRTLEKSYPYMVGILAALGYMVILWASNDSCFIKNILPEAINISAITMGFLATAKAILFSISDRKVVIELQDAGRYEDVVKYLMTGIRWSLGLAVLSIVYRMFNLPIESISWPYPYTDFKPLFHFITACFWTFVAGTMLASFYRITSVFAKMLV